jgi:hypothetical protein
MPLSADDRIILLRVKIERAKQHIRDLEKVLIAAGHQGKNIVLPYEDPDTGKIEHQRTWVLIYPFDALAIAGDIVHALRSALDHLAYQLSIAGTDKTPTRRVEFPIAKDWNTYEIEKPRKVEGIRPEAVEAIDRLKPYKGGNEVLWRIHELDNTDKHRFIFTVADDTIFSAPWFGGEFLLRPRGLKADAPLFSSVLDPDVDYEMNFLIAEALAQPKIGQSNALLPSLRQWINYVEGIIMDFRQFL